MTTLYINNGMKEMIKKFQKSMSNYFAAVGDAETWEDIQTESNERLIIDALSFAEKYFIDELDRIKKEANQG